jgi:hypothetical protein
MRLFHGTDKGSADDIMRSGVNAGLAASFNATGEFWATSDIDLADIFAQVNPAGGEPARLEFEIPDERLTWLLAQGWVLTSDRDLYEFLPMSFLELNRCATMISVTSPVP